jgi:hypothetical protein
VSRDDILKLQETVMTVLCNPRGRAGSDLLAVPVRRPENMRVLAMFAHSKRMVKIEHVLPATRRILDADWVTVSLEFGEHCPPDSGTTLGNAGQFCRFLRTARHPAVGSRPYLADLASCELALATLGRAPAAAVAPHAVPVVPAGGAVLEVRRASTAVLHRSEVPIFAMLTRAAAEPVAAGPAGPAGECIALTRPAGSGSAMAMLLDPDVYSLVSDLDHWTRVRVDSPDTPTARLLSTLTHRGIIEMRCG